MSIRTQQGEMRPKSVGKRLIGASITLGLALLGTIAFIPGGAQQKPGAAPNTPPSIPGAAEMKRLGFIWCTSGESGQ